MRLNFLKLVIFLTISPLLPRDALAELLDDHCPVTQIKADNGQTLLFFEHVFADGVHDLAIAQAQDSTQGLSVESQTLKRVTFGGERHACNFSNLAIARGGDWGWHLVWSSAKKPSLYYARMDGEAWVSSPVKRLSVSSIAEVALVAELSKVTINWLDMDDDKHYAAISDDEGRSWQRPQLVIK